MQYVPEASVGQLIPVVQEERSDGFFDVDIERFQGPLDLLLHLIRTQDIDIFDIPVSTITEQFLQTIKKIRVEDLDSAGEFLEMAAMLVRIKAQMLLPRSAEDEDEDPRAELVRRLLEYEQIREITQRLSVAEADRGRRFSKGYVPPRPRKPLTETPLETTWEEVFAAALLVELPEPREREHRVTTRTVAMEDKVILILDTLKEATRVEFSKLLEGFMGRMHGVMTFLAGLELTRRRLLFLRQTEPFTELWLYRRDDAPEDEEGEAGDEPAPAHDDVPGIAFEGDPAFDEEGVEA
ncbi:MAG: segregation/condensation protein A [Gemmatimonadota bacterium]|nr:segregation/condensation protein A [Gemmatimonadota bacterium]